MRSRIMVGLRKKDFKTVIKYEANPFLASGLFSTSASDSYKATKITTEFTFFEVILYLPLFYLSREMRSIATKKQQKSNQKQPKILKTKATKWFYTYRCFSRLVSIVLWISHKNSNENTNHYSR